MKVGKEYIAICGDAGDGAELFEVQKLVRCKECKKAKSWKCPFYRAGYTYKADDYCSDGERKEE